MNRRIFFRGLVAVAVSMSIPLKAVGVFDTVFPNEDSILQVMADNCARDIENYVLGVFAEGGST